MENEPPKVLYDNLAPDYEKTFSTIIILMKFIGIDIFGPKVGLTNVNATVRLFITFILYLPFVLLQFRLILSLDESESLTEGAIIFPTIIIILIDIVKMPAVLLMKTEIKELIMEIGELWPRSLVASEKKDLFQKWLRKLSLVYKTFFGFITGSVIYFMFMPLVATCYNISRGKPEIEYMFPFKQYSLWTINSTSVYLGSYVWQLAPTLTTQLSLYHSYDFLVIVTTFNLSTLFRILQVDLKDAIKASCATRKNMSVTDEDYAKIKNVVMTHHKLLSLVDKLNNCFGLVVFTHTGMSSLLIGFFCFMSVAFRNLEKNLSHIFSLINMSSTIFLLALAGQLLSDTSSGIAEAAYDSVWYDSDAKVKKLVLFIMIRSQQASYLSALNYSTMTITSFSKICSTAWTYVSLLTQMFD